MRDRSGGQTITENVGLPRAVPQKPPSQSLQLPNCLPCRCSVTAVTGTALSQTDQGPSAGRGAPPCFGFSPGKGGTNHSTASRGCWEDETRQYVQRAGHTHTHAPAMVPGSPARSVLQPAGWLPCWRGSACMTLTHIIPEVRSASCSKYLWLKHSAQRFLLARVQSRRGSQGVDHLETAFSQRQMESRVNNPLPLPLRWGSAEAV